MGSDRMKLPISKRLLACAGFLTPGARVADVGTDHGYLAIYLVQSALASHVLASDIRPGPLARAKENAARFGVQDRISFYLTDGVRGLPREFDTLLLAGMGAETMIHILRDAPWLHSGYRLVLQCQSSQNELRQYLSLHDWRIIREEPVLDKFLYTVLEAVPGRQILTPAQHFVTPALQRCGGELVERYIRFCRRTVEAAAQGMRLSGGPKYAYYCQALEGLREMEASL